MNKPAKPCGGKIKMKKQKAEGITIIALAITTLVH